MYGMFFDATSFNGDLPKWDVSNVEDMTNMFHKTLTINGGMLTWHMSSVGNMNAMFFDAPLFNGDLSKCQSGMTECDDYG